MADYANVEPTQRHPDCSNYNCNCITDPDMTPTLLLSNTKLRIVISTLVSHSWAIEGLIDVCFQPLRVAAVIGNIIAFCRGTYSPFHHKQ